jgi:hypothetical protein
MLPTGGHPDYMIPFRPDVPGGLVDMKRDESGVLRIFTYTVDHRRDLADPSFFLTKRFPQFMPCGNDASGNIRGSSSMYFLEKSRVENGINHHSVWKMLKDQVELETGFFPPPGPEYRTGTGEPLAVMRSTSGGIWNFSLRLNCGAEPFEGISDDIPARAFHSGVEYCVTKVSMDNPLTDTRVLEMRVTRRGERALTYRLVEEGDVRRFERPIETKSRLLRRWMDYFDQCWQEDKLMSDALHKTIRWFKRVCDEEGTEMPFPGDSRRGWALNKPNLNPQLNFVALLMDLAEFPLDILINHQNFVRALLCFKGVSKGDNKPPHMMWVGAMAAGKSHLAREVVGNLMPPDILVPASNVSGQVGGGQAPHTPRLRILREREREREREVITEMFVCVHFVWVLKWGFWGARPPTRHFMLRHRAPRRTPASTSSSTTRRTPSNLGLERRRTRSSRSQPSTRSVLPIARQPLLFSPRTSMTNARSRASRSQTTTYR